MRPTLPLLCLLSLPAAALAQTGPACQPATAPVLTLSYDSRYAEDDAQRAELDPEAEARAKAALDPLDDFIRDLGDALEALLQRPADDRADAADCLLQRLSGWAKAGALTDLRTETVELTIGSRLAALGLIASVASGYSRDAQARDAVSSWLADRVTRQMTFWESAPDGARRGNLRAWAALAAAATARLNDDPVMRGWAAWSVTFVACTADDAGALPQEMRRGKRALHYQLHAVAPLVTAAALLDRQGIDLMPRCDDALQRIVRFTLTDLQTQGAQSAAIAGAPQTLFTGDDPLEPFQMAWLEPWLALQSDPELEPVAQAGRPWSYSKLGGNVTLIWTD